MARIQHLQRRKSVSVVALSSLLAGAATQTASAHEGNQETTSALAVKKETPKEVTPSETPKETPKEAPKELTRDEKRAELKQQIEKVSAKMKLAENGEVENHDAEVAKKVQKLNLKSEKTTLETKVQAIDDEIDKEKEAERKATAEKVAKVAKEEKAKQEAKEAKKQKATSNTSVRSSSHSYSYTPTSTYDASEPATAGSIRPSIVQTANSYPWGQCTWGVKCLAPWAGNYWGNGNMWAASAASQGFKVGTTPKPGAIAVWSGNHVAYVTDVRSSTEIRVLESNYAGNQSIGDYRGWFNPVNAQGSVSYIYPPGT